MAWRSTSRIAFALLLLLLPACRQREEVAQAPAAAQAGCQRIISLTPSLTEIVFSLGLGDRVVGVGDYTTWPAEAVAKPKIGGLFNPNLERIVSLQPDLAVLLPSERDLAERLRPLGVDALIVQNESLAEVERSFHTIAQRCGAPKAGERLAAEWRQGLAAPPLPGPRLKVMLSAGRRIGDLGEVLVASRGTFLDELLTRAGADNAFPEGPTLYPQIGLEEVVARKPDVILELRADPLSPEKRAELVRDWEGLREIPAVREGRVEVIAGTHVLIPGPRLPQFYREMREALAR